MDESQLGFAGKVSEVTLGENKFTFVRSAVLRRAVRFLLQGPNDRTVTQIKDAVTYGLRVLKNANEF